MKQHLHLRYRPILVVFMVICILCMICCPVISFTSFPNWKLQRSEYEGSSQRKNILLLNAAVKKKKVVTVSSTSEAPIRKVKEDVVQVTGTVMEALPNTMFRVQIKPSNGIVLATLAGKMRKNHVKLLVGDVVVCDVSKYDPGRGRVVYRNNRNPIYPTTTDATTRNSIE